MSQFSKYIDRSITSITANQLYGATTINSQAFRNCYSLTSITIPDSVTSIGDFAFANCTSLTDCTILRTSGVIPLSSNNFNQISNKIYVPYSLLSNYKTATNWVGISDKIMGYQTFALNEILPRYNTTHTFTWYPSKADLILKTNGIVANGTNKATSAGDWYCERPMLRVDLISSEKSTSWTDPTSSIIEIANISFDKSANNLFPIYLKISVENNRKQLTALTSSINPNNVNRVFNYNQSEEFDNTESTANAWLKLYFSSTVYLRVENQTYFTSFPSTKVWQNITIHEAYQMIN